MHGEALGLAWDMSLSYPLFLTPSCVRFSCFCFLLCNFRNGVFVRLRDSGLWTWDRMGMVKALGFGVWRGFVVRG